MKNNLSKKYDDIFEAGDYDLIPAQEPIKFEGFVDDEGGEYEEFADYGEYGDEFDDFVEDIDISALTKGKRKYIDVSAEFVIPGYERKRTSVLNSVNAGEPKQPEKKTSPEPGEKADKKKREKAAKPEPPELTKPEPPAAPEPEASPESADIPEEPESAEPAETPAPAEEIPEKPEPRREKAKNAQKAREMNDIPIAETYFYSGDLMYDEIPMPKAAAPDFEPLPVPAPVMEIIRILKEHTYTSYLVGDCVNMMVLGERVLDFDIACSAELNRIIAIFEERFKVREDLLSRGELIIINGAMGISVAPYRSKIDGNGRPVYCKTIEEDLKRRTFTSETVAYNAETGIYDRFGGLSCITEEKTTLKAIDEEFYERMEIDALRNPKRKKKDPPPKVIIKALYENPESILTAMLKFSRAEAEISPFTLKNINDNPDLLDMIMPSEIFAEFKKILLGRRITETLIKFKEVIFHLFPVLREQEDFDQKSDYQDYDLYEHTARSVGYASPDHSVRLALLLHAVGKPDCAADRGDYYTYDGHVERGIMLARDIMEEMELDEQTRMRVLFLIRHHDDKITPDNVMDYTTHYGADMTRLLLLLQSANIRAKSADDLNDRVSESLRQLAESVGASAANAANARRGRLRRTGTFNTDTIEGLRRIVGNGR